MWRRQSAPWGVDSPLMVMKGDDGATGIDAFRIRPIPTILSGPAASVAGALLCLKMINWMFVGVGGTRTNICVIRRGKPEFRYVAVRDHPRGRRGHHPADISWTRERSGGRLKGAYRAVQRFPAPGRYAARRLRGLPAPQTAWGDREAVRTHRFADEPGRRIRRRSRQVPFRFSTP